MKLLSFLVFLVLQIAFLPLAVLGFVIVAYKQMVVSKRLGVSQTMVEVLNARWTMHVFGIRRDAATARLADVVPNTSTFGLWLCLAPLWAKYKLSGEYFAYPLVPREGSESLANFIIARTRYIDRIIQRVVGDMDQFVMLGAGYDTRAYGDLMTDGLTIFELDRAATQELKINSLAKAGIDVAKVTFVPVDFSREDAFERLRTAGYDPTKRTLFLWEGVTLYLSEQDVRGTLRGIREQAVPGSVVIADLYSERFIRMGSGFAAKKSLEYTDETLGFGLPFATSFEENLESFARSEGLTVGETFFFGPSGKKGPFMAVAELGVP